MPFLQDEFKFGTRPSGPPRIVDITAPGGPMSTPSQQRGRLLIPGEDGQPEQNIAGATNDPVNVPRGSQGRTLLVHQPERPTFISAYIASLPSALAGALRAQHEPYGSSFVEGLGGGLGELSNQNQRNIENIFKSRQITAAEKNAATAERNANSLEDIRGARAQAIPEQTELAHKRLEMQQDFNNKRISVMQETNRIRALMAQAAAKRGDERAKLQREALQLGWAKFNESKQQFQDRTAEARSFQERADYWRQQGAEERALALESHAQQMLADAQAGIGLWDSVASEFGITTDDLSAATSADQLLQKVQANQGNVKAGSAGAVSGPVPATTPRVGRTDIPGGSGISLADILPGVGRARKPQPQQANGGGVKVGQVVTVRGKQVVVKHVYPDGSFD